MQVVCNFITLLLVFVFILSSIPHSGLGAILPRNTAFAISLLFSFQTRMLTLFTEVTELLSADHICFYLPLISVLINYFYLIALSFLFVFFFRFSNG